jgi:hypothetical protein
VKVLDVLRRLRGEAGQTAIDFVGIVAVAALLLVLMLAAAPGWGQALSCKVADVLAEIGIGSGCSTSSTNADGSPKLDKCVLSDHSGKASASVTVFSVKGGGNIAILKQKRGDGTWAVTTSAGGELGVEGGIGGGGEVEGGDWQVGGRLEGKGGVNGQGELGSTYVVDSEKAADDIIDIYRNQARDSAIAGTAGPASGLLHWGLDKAGLTEDRDLPDPDQTYYQGGVGLTGKGSVGPLEANASGSALLGYKVDNKTGEKTAYYKLATKGQAGAGLVGAGINGDAGMQMAITLDKDGNAKTATLTRTYGYAGQAPALTFKNMDKGAYFRSLGLTGDASSGHRVEITQTLDLTDPANAQALTAWGAGQLPSLVTGSTPGVVKGQFDLVSVFDERAGGNVRRYSTDESKYGAGASGALGIKFGVEGSYEGKDSTLEGAEYWTPGGSVQQWAACSQ